MTDYAFAAEFLADKLAAACILVNNDTCAKCKNMSREACRACWLDIAEAMCTPAEQEQEAGE